MTRRRSHQPNAVTSTVGGMQTRVFNPGPDDFVTGTGRLWPALTERTLDPAADARVGRAVTRGRLTDLGPAPTPPAKKTGTQPPTTEGDA